MSKAIEILLAAQRRAIEGRPKVGGFPYLAESLRQAGVTSNTWNLPSCQSTYITEHGAIIQQLDPLAKGTVDVPIFNEDALVKALRADQAGETTFLDFLTEIWRGGVIRYTVDLTGRCVTYYGALDEYYKEHYPKVAL